MAAPRLIRNAVTRRYSPYDILSQFDSGILLTVKKSLKHHRFFMYEEVGVGGASKLEGNVTPTIMVKPNELQTLLQTNRNKSDYHYYWTSPVASVATSLSNEFQWHKELHSSAYTDTTALLDPRGPSLWMGTSGSGTQCHYDVANNIIIQLCGTKRIRIYPPIMGVYNLHVFPDAHQKARKSQIDFDHVVTAGEDDDDMICKRFPHYFDNIPQSTLDVTLQPGDAIYIPAFWFHHVENGYNGHDKNNSNSNTKEIDDVPISLNSFALSKPMMIAQQIFQKASRPLGSSMNNNDIIHLALKELGQSLIRGLEIVEKGQEKEFIHKYLLKARYYPLHHGNCDNNTQDRHNIQNISSSLTSKQLQSINSCINRILPEFQQLIVISEKENDNMNMNGIVLLVALHLLELWAVELVGHAKYVENAWEDALSS